MLEFFVIRGKKKVVGLSLNHTSRARVEHWPLVSPSSCGSKSNNALGQGLC